MPASVTRSEDTPAERLSQPHSGCVRRDQRAPSRRSALIRRYRSAADVPAKKLAVFTSQPRWSRLQHLHVTHANELDTLASRGWITHGDLPAEGRYLAVAIPLLTRTNGRPALKAAWVAAVGVES